MLVLFDDNIFENGAYFGSFEPKIDDEWRLRLPKKIVNTLGEHGVTKLYRCPDPTGERFILCPAEHWKDFVKAVRKHFAESPDVEKAFRLLYAATHAHIDSQGRIRITKACLDHAKVGAGDRVSVLGVGKWYEISGL